VNRRAFLARVGLGGVTAAAVVAAAGVGSVAGAPGGPTGRRGTAAPAAAVVGTGVELVVNGSFEDGVPGADIVGWQVLV
jgi:hypothetical protein